MVFGIVLGVILFVRIINFIKLLISILLNYYCGIYRNLMSMK